MLEKKLLEKYFCQGKKFCWKKCFYQKKNCWKKKIVAKKFLSEKNIFLQKKKFIKKKFLLKTIVTDFIADFVSDKLMLFFFLQYLQQNSLMSCSNSDDVILTMSCKMLPQGFFSDKMIGYIPSIGVYPQPLSLFHASVFTQITMEFVGIMTKFVPFTAGLL